jgi:hypothetical protein
MVKGIPAMAHRAAPFKHTRWEHTMTYSIKEVHVKSGRVEHLTVDDTLAEAAYFAGYHVGEAVEHYAEYGTYESQEYRVDVIDDATGETVFSRNYRA